MSDNDTFKSFSTSTGNSSSASFLESNSLVAKFAFLLLVIFAFIILLRIGISVVSYFFKPNWKRTQIFFKIGKLLETYSFFYEFFKKVKK